MGKNQSTWGSGGASGKRIPDTEDKPVSKAFSPSNRTSEGVIRRAYEISRKRGGMADPVGRRAEELAQRGQAKKVDEINGLKPGQSRHEYEAFTHNTKQRNREIRLDMRRTSGKPWSPLKDRGVAKAMPGSALSHMMPKAAAPLAPKSAKPVTSLKPTKPMAVGKSWKTKAAVGAGVVGGASLAYSATPHGQRTVRESKMASALYRTSPDYRHLSRAERKWTARAATNGYDSRRGVKGRKLGPYPGDASRFAPVGKRARFYDPEDKRQRSLGAAEGLTAGAGAAATYSGLKGSAVNRGKAREVKVGSVKLGSRKPITSVRIKPRLAGGLALLGAAGGIERHARSTAGRQYR